ncbi:ABC transporter ATP-binding protein [Bacillus sp. DTU_2020_1000418_1_SI_GHA_SEK_038]|uniref:ABC transporter ATP-binding protein n=1 Tax=Bacillus sp. DTU_2020_1000418_1_SI_GHA_SEK_038 TaxID=3077585 RepID=UPI0028EE2DD1|nr:ABC transporter ATP-binding protein [Bacillus sp. DTU_2020_1000418_1_SI_GHA_SEK_038]WNS74735.1 ABC transporter ATP-binding protein [Bacillus sp. DTU_2020_1000418_1_SI_GHA_SEK_038]
MTLAKEQEEKIVEYQDQEIILKIKNLKKYFPIKAGIIQKTVGHVKAVDDISVEVRKGETLGIVGESGCGKSTMGRTLIRLYDPTEGSIEFKGKDISTLSERQLKRDFRRQIQMIFQDPYASLNPRRTVRKTLLDPLVTHKLYDKKEDYEKRIIELLEIVGLDASAINRYPHEFSGGQRQRIGIARAIALNPDVIIADEAVSALDVSIQAQIINLLKDLQDELQLTYIFISHDLSVVRHISDRVAVMYLGKIMELANRDDLFDNPLHPYSQALLSAVPEMDLGEDEQKRERVLLKGDLPSPSSPPSGCVFHTRCPAAMPHCMEVMPSLEEVSPNHFVSCHLFKEQ